MEIATGKVIGAEALIRWNHSKLGWIRPDQFIPTLEKNGYIYEVDQFIWEETCRFLADRKKKGLRQIPISVNVARSDLYQKDLISVFHNLLAKYDLDASLLHLEVIERSYAKDSETMLKVLSQLRAEGFPIEMDDFGTGESSLAMVSRMPVDYLKLDRQFVNTDLSDERHTEIIQFIINLAHTLHIETLAEGVETEEQATLLDSMGCHYAQGYYYAKPMPAEELKI